MCRLFNWSLEHGIVPSSLKSAYITPLLKKADLDPADVKSYRPISNLSVVSKLLELQAANDIPKRSKSDLQSAYRTNHSTETAVLTFCSRWTQKI